MSRQSLSEAYHVPTASASRWVPMLGIVMLATLATYTGVILGIAARFYRTHRLSKPVWIIIMVSSGFQILHILIWAVCIWTGSTVFAILGPVISGVLMSCTLLPLRLFRTRGSADTDPKILLIMTRLFATGGAIAVLLGIVMLVAQAQNGITMRDAMVVTKGNTILFATPQPQRYDEVVSLFLMSVMIGCVVLNIFAIRTFFKGRVGQHPYAMITSVLVPFFMSVLLICYVVVIKVTDAGYLLRSQYPIWTPRMMDQSWTACNRCETRRPPTTIHCNSCESCVMGYDHHCGFLNKCIGKNNLFLFTLFTILWYVLVIFILITGIILGIRHRRYHGTIGKLYYTNLIVWISLTCVYVLPNLLFLFPKPLRLLKT